MSSLLVLDQGSTATKGALLDESGQIVAQEEVPVTTNVDGVRVEFDAEAVLDGVEEVLERCAGEGEPRAMALACQRSTCLIWDRNDGRPLTPALSWQDRRETERVRILSPAAEMVSRLTGLRLSPHYAAPKLAGLFERNPELARRATAGEAMAGTFDGWLVHRLTGRPSTEPGIAGRTLLYDLEDNCWSPALLDLFGIPEQALPPLRPSREERGSWRDIPLVAVVGDHQAALLGHGGWNAGVCSAHFGTGAAVLLGTGSEIRRHEGLLSAVLATTSTDQGLDRHFLLEGPINSVGSAVDMVVAQTGESLDTWQDRPLPDMVPMVLPALAGVAAPWWRAEVEALIPEDEELPDGPTLLASVLAGIAHRVGDIVEAMSAAGEMPTRLRASGKLARLQGFMQRISDVTGIPVEVAAEEEAGLVGLFRLAQHSMTKPPTPSNRRYEPEWPSSQRDAQRQRWLGFISGRLGLDSSTSF